MRGGLTLKRIGVLAASDFRNIRRDSTLVAVSLAPLLIIVFLRFGIPFAADFLSARLSFNLAPYFPFMTGFMALFPSMLFGVASGFIALDERDEDILSYTAVTPLTREGHVSYRLIVPACTGFLTSGCVMVFAGLDTPPLSAIFFSSLLAAFEAPLITLFLVSFAGNKVEGLALSKASGVLEIAPLAILFIPGAWQYAAWIFPSFWVVKAYQIGSGGYLPALLVFCAGAIVHGLWLALAWKMYRFRILCERTRV
jgi:fluoroquinolone transport system permease protein